MKSTWLYRDNFLPTIQLELLETQWNEMKWHVGLTTANGVTDDFCLRIHSYADFVICILILLSNSVKILTKQLSGVHCGPTNIRRHRKKCSGYLDQAPGICAPLHESKFYWRMKTPVHNLFTAYIFLSITVLDSLSFRYASLLRAVNTGAHPRGLPGCSPPPPKSTKTEIKKKQILSKVLRDLPFSRNQPIKSADD
jgi:hypothetical protein